MAMHAGNHLEPTEGWREAGVSVEEWARLESLLELVRREHQRTELSPERRDQIRDRVLAPFAKLEARRRRGRVFFAAAGVALAAGAVATAAMGARAD
jgi:hypothetical protein